MHVEFFGIPRERAGISEVEVDAATLGEALTEVVKRFPALGEVITPAGLHPSISANLNGDLFVSDLNVVLDAADRLILLSADAGG